MARDAVAELVVAVGETGDDHAVAARHGERMPFQRLQWPVDLPESADRHGREHDARELAVVRVEALGEGNCRVAADPVQVRSRYAQRNVLGLELLKVGPVGDADAHRRPAGGRRHDDAVAVRHGEAECLWQSRQAFHHLGFDAGFLQRAAQLIWMLDVQYGYAVQQIRQHEIDRLDRTVDLIGDDGGDVGRILDAFGDHDRPQPQDGSAGRCRCDHKDQQRRNDDCAHGTNFGHSRRLRSVHPPFWRTARTLRRNLSTK
jgi:hypothetical protein